MPGLGVENLHPGVEMTHVGVGQVDKRLNLGIDCPEDTWGQQIVDDDGPVLPECSDDLTDRSVCPNPLESTVLEW
jgi:hypothetical protein